MLRTNRKLVFLMQMRDSRGPFILSIAYAVHELGHYVEDKSYISFFFHADARWSRSFTDYSHWQQGYVTCVS
jgi:hypothetical protein